MNQSTYALIATATLLAGSYASAQTPAADNARTNQTDPSNRTATADSQSNDPADVDLTKRVRQSVMADKSLSTDGHNVKIVSAHGAVTLNGVVQSEQEKSRIEMKAVEVAGKEHVTNDLKVVAAK
jgi:hyperosmotically inducible periplasmic protein